MKEVLLTGTSGYLGHALAKMLEPQFELKRLTARLAEIQPESLHPDCVIHLAGALRHRETECFETNFLGFQSLLKGLAHPKIPIVYFSSRAVYAPHSEPLQEDSPLASAEAYGQSKIQAERLLLASGHPFLILRPTLIWGWNGMQAGRSFIAQAAKRLMRQETLTLYLPPRNHDSLYVQDLARWLPSLLSPGPHWNQAFNLAAPPTDFHTLILHLAQEVERQCGHSPQIQFQPGPPARAPLLSLAKFRQTFPQLGWTPEAQILKALVQGLKALPE